MKRKIYFILIGVCLILSGYLFAFIQKDRNVELKQRITELQSAGRAMTQSINDYYSEIATMEKKFDSIQRYFIKDYEIRNLKEKLNIGDPVKYIKKELEKRKDLIPIEGVLGGTMHFSKIALLNGKWIYAFFEDGHIGGYLLIKYSVKENRNIKWEVMDKEL